MRIGPEQSAVFPLLLQKKESLPSSAVFSVLNRMRQMDTDSVANFLYGSLTSSQRKTILATPSGAVYEPLYAHERPPIAPSIGYFGPHPSDLVDFLGGTVGLLRSQGYRVSELLLTEGEKGVDHLSEKDARKLRRRESKKAARLQGVTLRYLKDPLGSMLPDGKLFFYMRSLTGMIKEAIRSQNFDIIFAPAPELDHPDHVAAHLATIDAVLQLAAEGHFREKRLPALYITDPEFGYASGGEWAVDLATRALPSLPGRRGRMMPQSTQTFIIDVSSQIHDATDALYAHRSQMVYGNGRAKDYAEKIPALKRLLGTEVQTDFAERFRQVFIPGVTASENRLLPLVPAGSMYQMGRIDQL